MDKYNRCSSYPWKTPTRILLTLCLMAAAAGLRAQSGGTEASSFYFPRFLNGSGFDTGLAIFNPTKSDAVANLTLVDAKGNNSDPVSITVPPLGRAVLTASKLSGSSDINASLRVTSTTAGLYATYSTYDTAGTFMDGTGGAQSSLQLVFPVAPGASTTSMELFLRNATAQNTSVELTVWDLGGTALGSGVVRLPAGESFRGFAGSIFPSGTNYSNASHITAKGKPWNLFSPAQPFWGTSIFSGTPPFSSGTDVAALNGLALTEAVTAGAIPYFRTGGGYFSVVSIANVESASIDVTLNAVRNDGTSAGTRAVNLKANGGLRETVEFLFPSLASGEQQGWILVQATGRIAANLLYGQTAGGSLSAVPLQAAPQYRTVFPQAVRNSSFNTGVSIVNPGPDAGDAAVYIVNPAGTTLAATRVPLAAGQRIGFVLDELFPEVTELPGGLIAVVASQPVFASASLGSGTGTTVISFAPAPVPATYAPNPLTTFAVKGSVTLNGEAADGFRVIISGPVGEVTTTAEDGTYEFSGLPAGKYSMKVDQYGFEFMPAVTNFEITSFNIYQEFVGFTRPGEILLLPASIPVGSPDTKVRVFGTGFNETSEAFVETVRLKTTYLSSTRMEILIPAYMADTASTFAVYVVTNGSSDNPSVTTPYPVVVYLDRPQLSSASTVGDIMEGALGAVLDLQGSGFLPGAKVKINGQSDGVLVNLISDKEIVANVPPSYLQVGGIYPVTVENPFPSLNAESNIQLMTVYFPTPGVQGLNPTFLHVQLEATATPQLDVFGYQFRRGAVVMFETDSITKSPLPTVYRDNSPAGMAEQLTATIPPEYLRKSGFARITVQNPMPSLPGSEARVLRIEGLQPTITSVLPGSATILPEPPSIKPCPPDVETCPEEVFRMTMPILVDGTNIGIQTEARIARTCSEVSPPFGTGGVVIIGPTQLYVNWDVPPDALGQWCIQIKNPEPGGGVSEPAAFTLSLGNFVQDPFLVSISPASVTAGGGSFTLTVNGVNFKDGSQIYFSTTQLVTTFVSSTELRATVPDYLIKNAGKRPITVINPDNGGASNKIFIAVN